MAGWTRLELATSGVTGRKRPFWPPGAPRRHKATQGDESRSTCCDGSPYLACRGRRRAPQGDPRRPMGKPNVDENVDEQKRHIRSYKIHQKHITSLRRCRREK